MDELAASQTGSVEKRLRELGHSLPEVPAPIGLFSVGRIDHDRLYLSGQGPLLETGTLATGKVGLDVSTEQATYHAYRTGLVLISAMKLLLGDLDRVTGIVKLLGFVNAAAEFADHPEVINGCSNLFNEVFIGLGPHARSAIGVGSLPGNITVEIEAVVSIQRNETSGNE